MDSETSPSAVLTERLPEIPCAQCGVRIDVSEVEPFTRIACPQCHQEQTVPARLGSFLLLDLIGTGGMGGVYYAKDESLGRNVAIKVMLKSLGENVESLETFRREAQAVAKLNHPNIVQIYSFGQEQGQPYIVMELVSGHRFDKMIDATNKLDQAIALQIILDIAEALKAADDVGLIHGDIKPENILLDERWNAKLVDFGLASFVNQASDGGVWGTPYYIAPEKVRRRKTDARADIYSLGATLYHAIGGQPPFDGETPAEVVRARLENPPPPLHDARPDVNPEIERIVMRMLEPEPARRYPTYVSLISDLRKVQESMGGRQDIGRIMSRTGRMRITKKRSADIGTEVPRTEPGDAAVTGRQSKIIIRKGGMSAPLDDYRKASMGIATKPAEETASEEKKPRRTSRAFVVLGLFMLAAIGGAAFWLQWKDKQERATRIRVEQAALATALNTADKLLSAIQSAATNTVQMAAEVEPLRSRLAAAVTTTLGREFDLSPAVETPAPAPVDVPPADTNAVPVAGTNTVAAATTNAAPAVAAPAEAPAPPPPAPPADDPPVVRIAREGMAALQTLTRNAVAARDLAQQASNTCASVRGSRLSRHAVEAGKPLETLVVDVRRLPAESDLALKTARSAAERAETLATVAVRNREEERKRQEEAARVKAQEEAAGREARALAEKVKEEVAAVDLVALEVKPFLKKNAFGEAVTTAKEKTAGLETKEGRAAAQVVIDRCQRLKDLKTFLIERINAEPFRWGWVQARSQEDVIGADETLVRMRNSTATWEQVALPQMLHFIRHYLASREVSARVLADQHLNAAIFCLENGGADAAATYAEKAAELRPTLKDEVRRLLPLPGQN